MEGQTEKPHVNSVAVYLTVRSSHPVVRADDDLHLDDRALLVGFEDRVDAVLLPENVRPFRRRLLGITCRRNSYTRDSKQ